MKEGEGEGAATELKLIPELAGVWPKLNWTFGRFSAVAALPKLVPDAKGLAGDWVFPKENMGGLSAVDVDPNEKPEETGSAAD